MLEYIGVVGSGLRDLWAGVILPNLEMVFNSPYFWPGIGVAVLVLILLRKRTVR